MENYVWITEEEKETIEKHIWKYMRDDQILSAIFLKDMLTNLELIPNKILWNEGYEKVSILKEDYDKLAEIYFWYRSLVLALVRCESFDEIEKSSDMLTKLYDSFHGDSFWWLYHYDYQSNLSCGNFEKIQGCNSVRDILLMATCQCLNYEQYKELVETYMYIQNYNEDVEARQLQAIALQEKSLKNNPIEVLERHSEYVDLYDFGILMSAKKVMMDKLVESEYGLGAQNQVFETLIAINKRLERRKI